MGNFFFFLNQADSLCLLTGRLIAVTFTVITEIFVEACKTFGVILDPFRSHHTCNLSADPRTRPSESIQTPKPFSAPSLIQITVISRLDFCSSHLKQSAFSFFSLSIACRVILFFKKNQIISLLSKNPPRTTHLTKIKIQIL